jgi:hypothetical protein
VLAPCTDRYHRAIKLRAECNVPVVVRALQSIELDHPVVDARHILCVVGIEVGSGLTAENLRPGGVFLGGRRGDRNAFLRGQFA